MHWTPGSGTFLLVLASALGALGTLASGNASVGAGFVTASARPAQSLLCVAHAHTTQAVLAALFLFVLALLHCVEPSGRLGDASSDAAE